MKTYSPKPEHIEHRWYVLDASGQVLGRLATEVATLLRGKHKPMFAPHMDTGDHVIVINADKVELTGNKAKDKYAYRHSGYPGGITAIAYGDLIATRPIAAVEKAVRGMLPKNTIGRQMINKLHVIAGPEHPHAAQKPVALVVGQRPVWEGLPTTAEPKAVKPKAEKPAAKPKAEKPAAKPKATTAKPKATTAKPKATTAKPKTEKTAAKPKATAATTKSEKAPAEASSEPEAGEPAADPIETTEE